MGHEVRPYWRRNLLGGVYRGLQVEGGAEGVGKQTTSSVVTSIFLIIIVDLFFTVLFYFL